LFVLLCSSNGGLKGSDSHAEYSVKNTDLCHFASAQGPGLGLDLAFGLTPETTCTGDRDWPPEVFVLEHDR